MKNLHRHSDLVLKQNFDLSLDQSSLSYKMVEDEYDLQENELVLEDCFLKL